MFPAETIGLACLAAGSYLLGAIPFGLLIGLLAGVDARRTGSGNTGATNILRSAGKGPALATLLLDAGKGAVPVLLAGRFAPGEAWAVAAGGAAILGHNYSPFLGFRGGKGVATSAGALFALSPAAAALALAAWIVVYLARRTVSLASICAAASLPFLLALFHGMDSLLPYFGILVALVVIVAHRDNIRRILAGREPRTTFSKWKKRP